MIFDRESGYTIHRGVFDRHAVEALRSEARRVAQEADAPCVRHLERHSDLFRRLPESAPMRQLLPPGLRRVRSLLFDKTAAANWPVPWHQDLTVAVAEKVEVEGYGPWSVKDGAPHVQPPTTLLEGMTTVRIHLDDVPVDNGALWVLPGSHRRGKLEEFGDPWKEGAVACECETGDVLTMSPLLLHASRRAAHPRHRRVLHYEFAHAGHLDPRLQWPAH